MPVLAFPPEDDSGLRPFIVRVLFQSVLLLPPFGFLARLPRLLAVTVSPSGCNASWRCSRNSARPATLDGSTNITIAAPERPSSVARSGRERGVVLIRS